jgi:mono/diheme cytochrome c family protein
MKLPRWLLFTAAILVVLSWVPLALIMRARVTTSPQPRFHIVPDMDNQPKYKAQSRNPMFADRRAMRPPVAGAVARGTTLGDPALTSGKIGEDWIEVIPVEVDRGLLENGRERYDVYCSPCHGLAGFGDGMVAKRADELAWSPSAPTSCSRGPGRRRRHSIPIS